MAFIIGLLTFILVLDCALLIFLVLLQLPKKEAGAGLAFGGAATDALFGAGSGNVLTKVTKYAATLFFVLAIVLAAMQRTYSGRRTSGFERALQQPRSAATAPITQPSATPATPPSKATPPQALSTNALLSTTAAEATNVAPPAISIPAPAASTNAPAAP